MCVHDYSRTTNYEAAHEQYQLPQYTSARKKNLAILLKRRRLRAINWHWRGRRCMAQPINFSGAHVCTLCHACELTPEGQSQHLLTKAASAQCTASDRRLCSALLTLNAITYCCHRRASNWLCRHVYRMGPWLESL